MLLGEHESLFPSIFSEIGRFTEYDLIAVESSIAAKSECGRFELVFQNKHHKDEGFIRISLDTPELAYIMRFFGPVLEEHKKLLGVRDE
jgi:hypothetical protein